MVPRPKNMTIFSLVAAFWLGVEGPSSKARAESGRPETLVLDPKTPPSEDDWRYLLRMPGTDRQKLWDGSKGRGIALKDWTWEWRLGWLRACARERLIHCDSVLEEGIMDRALVVRAEAATHIGRIYEGTGHPRALALLDRSFREGRNHRHGRPLFVAQRILFAIHRIGGARAKILGDTLAAPHTETKTYWEQLQRTP